MFFVARFDQNDNIHGFGQVCQFIEHGGKTVLPIPLSGCKLHGPFPTAKKAISETCPDGTSAVLVLELTWGSLHSHHDFRDTAQVAA